MKLAYVIYLENAEYLGGGRNIRQVFRQHSTRQDIGK
jgi:hypothetical protein